MSKISGSSSSSSKSVQERRFGLKCESYGSVLFFFVLLGLLGSSLSQTFQYSRGWTNGKRSSLYPSVHLSARNALGAPPSHVSSVRIDSPWALRKIVSKYGNHQSFLPTNVPMESREDTMPGKWPVWIYLEPNEESGATSNHDFGQNISKRSASMPPGKVVVPVSN